MSLPPHPNAIPKIVVTAGEPAGIGLDLCVALAHTSLSAQITVVTNSHTLLERAALLKQTLNIQTGFAQSAHRGDGNLAVIDIACPTSVVAGQLNPKNSTHVLQMLDFAIDSCLSGKVDAMVTAPVHKEVINEAGIAFSGHTEYLAEKTNTAQVVMMLVGGGMRVALATTHLPLSKVSEAITQASLTQTIRILHADLISKFGISSPRIYVAGLNPHAGEGGYLGDEEIDTINPVLETLRKEGMDLVGAMPADTMFSQKNLHLADAFLAMYHDQGLPVLKHASFGQGVNITLGLPIIRTSVDHGTALDLAGTGKADIGSLLAAIELAIDLADQKNHA